MTPHNLFLSEDREKILIADLEFEALRKYAGLFNGYNNRSAYVAPELLKEKGNSVIPNSEKCDIYSLGMIIWEIYAKTEPFQVVPSTPQQD